MQCYGFVWVYPTDYGFTHITATSCTILYLNKMKKTYLLTENGKTLVKATARKVKGGSVATDGFECGTIAWKNMRELIQLVSTSYEAMIYADAMICRIRTTREYNHWNNARNKAKVIWQSSVRVLKQKQTESCYDNKW